MKKSVRSWSWKSIQDVYAILGKQLEDLNGIQNRCSIPANIDIKYSEAENSFIIRFWRDVKRIEQHLQVLDAEIKRRNSLIGVI